MKELPLVSIFLPTFNYGHFLTECLESIYSQSYQNFELIIIDNNSTDNTKEIIDRYSNLFKEKLIYNYNSTNLGAEPSINKYLPSSKGEIITFQAADDIWLPTKLSKQVEALLNKEIDLVYSNFYYLNTIDPNHKTEKIAYNDPMPSGDIFEKLLFGNFIGANTVAIKRNALFQTGGFMEDYPLLADYIMWLKICEKKKVHYLDEPLVKIRIHGNNLSYRKLFSLRIQESIFFKNYLFNLPKSRLSFSKRLSVLTSSYWRIFKGIGILILRKIKDKSPTVSNP